MRRPAFIIALLCIVPVLAGSAMAHAAEGDLPGSRDYPGIARFTGSVITGYDADESSATRLQTAPYVLGDATGDRRLQGRVTRIAYRTGPGFSMQQVMSAFAAELARAGYQTVFSCDADACGRIAFSLGIDVLVVPQMWVDGLAYYYLVGRKGGDAGAETWATVLISHHTNTVTAQLVVTEVAAR